MRRSQGERGEALVVPAVQARTRSDKARRGGELAKVQRAVQRRPTVLGIGAVELTG